MREFGSASMAMPSRWTPTQRHLRLLDLLSRYKAGVVALLRAGSDGWSGEDWRALFDERAAIAEFDGGLPRLSAEARAFACCVAEWLNRNPVRSPPGRCLGCDGSAHANDKLLPFGTEPNLTAMPGCIRAAGRHGTKAGRAEAVATLSTFGICMRTSQ